jgi:hypothetical protein
MGTIFPLHELKKEGSKIDKKLEYPSSNLFTARDRIKGSDVYTESFKMTILLSKYFEDCKFIGSKEDFRKDVHEIYDPMASFKLSNMLTDKKVYKTLLNELKKMIKMVG